MPRRSTPDPLAAHVGGRIRALRQQAGMTLEGLAFRAEVSKGHLSLLERGLVMPTVATLEVLAPHLGVLAVDLLNDPGESDRAKLLELSRSIPRGALRKLVKDVEADLAHPHARQR